MKSKSSLAVELVKQIKKKAPKNLDELFDDAHTETFEVINCLDCAACCKTHSPMFFEKDIERLAKHLRMSPGAFTEKYLFLDTDGIFALKVTPCPFLGTDNYCSVYDHRPKACKEFPHTNHRKMMNHLKLLEKNATFCPAVGMILEKLEGIFFTGGK